MKLILTRHGETEENKEEIVQGQMPGKLSEKGISQAGKVALRLKDEEIDFIYSSDLKRASDTAKEIAKFHSDIPIEFVKDLREEYLGGWQGKNKEELGLVAGIDLEETFPEDGETFEELFNRAKTFLGRVLSKHINETILFVGHNRINRAIIAVIMNKNSKEIKLIERQHNASITIFEIDKDKNYKILVFNSIKHLDRI